MGIDVVIEAVSEYYGITVDELLFEMGKTRTIHNARKMAIYILSFEFGMTLTQLSGIIMSMTYSQIMQAKERTTLLFHKSIDYKKEVTEVMGKINSQLIESK